MRGDPTHRATWSSALLATQHPAFIYIDTFEKLKSIADKRFGSTLNDDYKEAITNFAASIAKTSAF